MRRVRQRAVLALVLLALVSTGCSSRAHFSYPHLTGPPHQGRLVGALQDACDRLADRAMTEFYDENVAAAITRALRGEMQEAGIFTRIGSLPGCAAVPPVDALREQGIDIVVKPEIDRLEWEVPGYAEILGTMAIVGVASGGLGAMIYGSTDTDVYGRVTLRVTLLDVRTGQTLDRVYDGEAHATVEKLESDRGTTRRDIVGRAFNHAMEPFRADLARLAAEPADSAVAAGMRCTMTFDVSGWSSFYQTARPRRRRSASVRARRRQSRSRKRAVETQARA